jgi:hypothetical protein
MLHFAPEIRGRNRHETGKWRRISKRPVEVTSREDHQGWQVVITRRDVGMTIRRVEYHATVRQDHCGHPHLMLGFRSAEAARRAAHHHIDFLRARQQARQRQARMGRAKENRKYG